MKVYNYSPYQYGAGLKYLNPSPPCPVAGAKILSHPLPTIDAGWEKPEHVGTREREKLKLELPPSYMVYEP